MGIIRSIRYMLDQSARRRVEVEARETAKRMADGMLAESRRTGQQFDGPIRGAIRRVRSEAIDLRDRLRDAFAPILALLSARGMGLLADEFKNLQSQLRLVTRDSTDLARVQGELFIVAQDTRTGLATTANLYASLARSTKQLGTSQSELLRITKAVQQSFLVSGRSASEQASSIRQLSQALGSGRLAGDEFNSIAENAPRLQQAVAESLGVTIGQLRQMAEEGKITADTVTKALLKSSGAIGREAATIEMTLGGAFNQLRNKLLLFVGEADKAQGVSQKLALGMAFLADNIKLVSDVLQILVATWIGRFIGSRVAMLGAMGAIAGAARAMWIAIGGPFAVVALGLFAALKLATHDVDSAMRSQAEGTDIARKAMDEFQESIRGATRAQIELLIKQKQAQLEALPRLGASIRPDGRIPAAEVWSVTETVRIRNELRMLREELLQLDRAGRTVGLSAEELAKQEKLRREEQQRRLAIIEKGVEFAQTESAALRELKKLESEVRQEIARGNIDFERRVQLIEMLGKLNTILAETAFAPKVGLARTTPAEPKKPGLTTPLDRAAERAQQNQRTIEADVRNTPKPPWGDDIPSLRDVGEQLFGRNEAGILGNDLADSMLFAAHEMDNAFQTVFENIFQDIGRVDEGFRNLGKGLAKALAGELAKLARTKALENLAWAVENTARGLASLAGFNPKSAGEYFASAGEHLAAAAAWGLVGGAIGAAGGGTAHPTTVTDVGGATAEKAGGPQTIIHLNIDGVDPNNPRHQQLVGKTVREYTEREGVQVVFQGGR